MTEVRLASLRARLLAEGVNAVALTNVTNVAYCTNFAGVFDDEPAHVALVTTDSATVFTDSRYAEAMGRAAEETPWRVLTATADLTDSVLAEATAAGVANLALETSLPYRRYQEFAERFAGSVVPATNWVEELRQVKNAEEIARVSAAQELTDRAFDHILGVIAAGARERDIALDLEVFMRREGSEGVAFPPIVASGPNSALPHASVTDRKLAEGDFVVLDFGARIDGYCADMTRTLVIGVATDEHRAVYEAVLAANLAGIGAVHSGRVGSEIDAAARSVLAERGFGDRFGHGLGHGVGREVHELPGVGPRSTRPVPLGSVITIEPGVYIPGFGGVRIEDLVVVEETRARVLTRSTKDLIEL